MKVPDIKFHGTASYGNGPHTCERTDRQIAGRTEIQTDVRDKVNGLFFRLCQRAYKLSIMPTNYIYEFRMTKTNVIALHNIHRLPFLIEAHYVLREVRIKR